MRMTALVPPQDDAGATSPLPPAMPRTDSDTALVAAAAAAATPAAPSGPAHALSQTLAAALDPMREALLSPAGSGVVGAGGSAHAGRASSSSAAVVFQPSRTLSAEVSMAGGGVSATSALSPGRSGSGSLGGARQRVGAARTSTPSQRVFGAFAGGPPLPILAQFGDALPAGVPTEEGGAGGMPSGWRVLPDEVRQLSLRMMPALTQALTLQGWRSRAMPGPADAGRPAWRERAAALRRTMCARCLCMWCPNTSQVGLRAQYFMLTSQPYLALNAPMNPRVSPPGGKIAPSPVVSLQREKGRAGTCGPVNRQSPSCAGALCRRPVGADVGGGPGRAGGALAGRQLSAGGRLGQARRL